MLTPTSMMPTKSNRKRLTWGFAGLRKYGVGASLMIIMAFFLSSCEKCCLCHKTPGESSVLLAVDWTKYEKERPTGMSVYFFDEATGTKSTFLTHRLDALEASLHPGEYSVLCISQSEFEYGSMTFEGMESIETAKIVELPIAAPTWASGLEGLIDEPKWIAADTIEAIVEGIGGWNACQCTNCQCVLMHGKPEAIGNLTPQNLIWTINVTVEIEGSESISRVRGILGGLASGMFLANGKPTDGSSAQMLTAWDGLKASIRSFGLTDYPKIFLQFLLKDGTIVDHTIDIGDNIAIDEEGKGIMIKIKIDKPLPNVKPGPTGGFDAEVNGWGDDDEVNLPM